MERIWETREQDEDEENQAWESVNEKIKAWVIYEMEVWIVFIKF